MKNTETQDAPAIGDVVEYRGNFWTVDHLYVPHSKWPYALRSMDGSGREDSASARELVKVDLETLYWKNEDALKQVEMLIAEKEQELAALRTSRITLAARIVEQRQTKDKG